MLFELVPPALRARTADAEPLDTAAHTPRGAAPVPEPPGLDRVETGARWFPVPDG